MKSADPLRGLDVRVLPSAALSQEDRRRIQTLFTGNYRQANLDYLEHTMSVLGYVALATEHGDPVGFAFSDYRITELPRMPELQRVHLGGIGCVALTHRRRGLFGRLNQLARASMDVPESPMNGLGCGRMAHPAGFRSMSLNPTVVPKYGVPITDWQREVGLKVAELYGVTLDPETFIVRGSGKPVGYPIIEVDVPDADWRLFEGVDRSRGDSLLGISWSPAAPEGWRE